MTQTQQSEKVKKNRGGRPKIEINYGDVERLGRIQCTQEEIASIMDVSINRLRGDDKFLEAHKKGLENGKSSLRRAQFKAALGGNATMLVWLGKQLLGQKDKHEHTGEGGGPIEIKAKIEFVNSSQKPVSR